MVTIVFILAVCIGAIDTKYDKAFAVSFAMMEMFEHEVCFLLRKAIRLLMKKEIIK